MSGFRKILVPVVSLGVALVGVVGSAPPVAAVRSLPGVCAGVSHCRVVARTDVDGDRRRDAVGLVRESEDRLQVRVRTARGVLVTADRAVSPEFTGNTWNGSAYLDRHRGRELVVRAASFTGNRYYHVLTWRRAGLVPLAQPGGSNVWATAGNGQLVKGYWHRPRWPRGVVMLRYAWPHDEAGKRYDATLKKYRNSGRGWVLQKSTQRVVSSRTAASWLGFHVRGLKKQ